MFADDAAAGRANDVSYKKNIHLKRLARPASISQQECARRAPMKCGSCDESTAILCVDDFGGSRLVPQCVSLLCMAKSGRFGLCLRILTVLAAEPGTMQTSAVIAKKLEESAVMVRRCFLLLHKKGLVDQRKVPKRRSQAKAVGQTDRAGRHLCCQRRRLVDARRAGHRRPSKAGRRRWCAGDERDFAGAGIKAHPEKLSRCEVRRQSGVQGQGNCVEQSIVLQEDHGHRRSRPCARCSRYVKISVGPPDFSRRICCKSEVGLHGLYWAHLGGRD